MTEHIHFPQHASEAFPKSALERIAHVIHDAEQAAGVQIRLSIRDMRDANEAHMELKELALREFQTLKLHKDDARMGILLFVLYDERKFYVVGDEGAHAKVHPESWKDVAHTLRKHFKRAEFEEGITNAVERIAKHLKGAIRPEDFVASDDEQAITMH